MVLWWLHSSATPLLPAPPSQLLSPLARGGNGYPPIAFLIDSLNPAETFRHSSFIDLFIETFCSVPSVSTGPLPGVMTLKSIRGSGDVGGDHTQRQVREGWTDPMTIKACRNGESEPGSSRGESYSRCSEQQVQK